MARLDKANAFFKRSKQFLVNDIWEVEADNFGKFKARLIKYARIILLTVKNFKTENVNLQSVALSFFTMLAFVPFIAVIFAISNYVGLGEYLKTLIYDNFRNKEIIDYLLVFANNIIATSRQGIYGIISFVVFLWTVIWLFMRIEKSLNSIWQVRRNRVIWKRFMAYFITLAVAPFVITIFLSVSFTITDGINTVGMSIPYMESFSTFLVWLSFYVFMVAGLTCMYIFIPNAKVRFLPALSSAMIAAFAFTVIQYLYLETQLFVSRMSAIYGVFAAVPLFLVWLNIGWFVILVGSDLSYAFQNVGKYPLEDLN